MTKEEKIEFILEVMPKVEKIIKFATEEQIEKLYEQGELKIELNLSEACYG